MTCSICGPGAFSTDGHRHELNGQAMCCSCNIVSRVKSKRALEDFKGLMTIPETHAFQVAPEGTLEAAKGASMRLSWAVPVW